MMMRLWQAERPGAVLVGWDSLETPTYRHQAFEPYQSGRVFEEPLLEQLALLPAVCEKLGFLVAKAPGYEADDFLAAAAQTWPGPVLVATSDRDAYQLVTDRVTVLAPTKGVSEVARIELADALRRGDAVTRSLTSWYARDRRWRRVPARAMPRRGARKRPPRSRAPSDRKPSFSHTAGSSESCSSAVLEDAAGPVGLERGVAVRRGSSESQPTSTAPGRSACQSRIVMFVKPTTAFRAIVFGRPW